MMEVPTPAIRKTPTCAMLPFALLTWPRSAPWTQATGQQTDPDHAVVGCRVVEPDGWCHSCGCQGVPRDTVLRRLAHVPLGWRPTILHVRVRRYRRAGCGRIWRQDTGAAAAPRSKLSQHAVTWALKCLVIDRMSITRIAAGLGVSWHTPTTRS